MLVISLDVDDSATITVPPSDEPQLIKVTAIRYTTNAFGPRVRLGFDAHRCIKILRDKLLPTPAKDVKAP
jgi:hypothetical protein